MKQRLYTSISGFALKCAFVITLLIGFNSWSQTDPVQATITTSPPFLNYLSYYGDQNNHLQITLTNLDFATPPILARLRIRIQGSGWQVYTNPNATIGQPFLLEAGMPVTISGIELLPYLQANNLINPNGVDLNNLPQGWTDICVDVIRVSASQQVLATNSCGFATIQNVQPPTPFLPTCGSRLDTTSMFENFQWFASNPPAVGMGIETQYDLNIYHWSDTTNFSPAAWAYNPVYFEPNINFGESFVVPMNQIPFVQGGKYVWTVTARVLVNGIQKNVITNNGVSAPCIFYYGEAQSLNELLADGLEIELFTQPSSPQKGKAWWTVTDNTPNQGLSNFDQFYVEYRKQPTGNEGFEIPWFHKTLTSLEHFIYQLEPSTTYEVKVSGIIGGVVGDPTPVETFTTLAPRVYNCGESDLPFLPTNYTPLANTTVGTQVQIGQFMMTMTQVNPLGQTGHYAGKGEIPIAFLMGAKAKVTFSDILIDTEFRVREGRVDVITEGLDSWLDNQMQQFIDPYFVDGTIDSAYVQDSLAWVVVDGVAQSFVFDPPHYPVIVNDASGNQYTIYPNGTIIIGTYLSVSETWAVAANETVRFGQNDAETRGFDPKEHQEWHENYETMQLSDNTFYYVANKSLAKSEGDMVNVQFPPNVTHVRFELANGDTIPYVDLEGSWMGQKPYLDSGFVKTLNLPSFSSGGKYELYAIADGVKIGQLNIQVYNEKTKDVIVVPLVSNVSFSATDIENELKRTLGEANITVNVTMDSLWVDSTGTFTATTNILLPTEVGLLTKYSDDMRDLRDAYFEQHPNAPKNKYYLFLVNGFDDPSELGYMVRGRSMGFVKVSSNQAQVLQTISHELGHGMGALEHTFKDNGIAQGSTSNLMDYSGETNLTIAQWKELRDLDLVPSLWDSAEDGSGVVLSVSNIPDRFKNPNGTLSFFSGDDLGKIITLPPNTIDVYLSTSDPFMVGNQLSSFISPIGSLKGFSIDNGVGPPTYYKAVLSPTFNLITYEIRGALPNSEVTASGTPNGNQPPVFDIQSTDNLDTLLAHSNLYTDPFSKALVKPVVIVGLPFYEGGEIGYTLYPSEAKSFFKPTTNENSFGSVSSSPFLVISRVKGYNQSGNGVALPNVNPDLINYREWFELHHGEGVSVSSTYGTEDLSPLALGYLDKFQGFTKKGSVLAPILIGISEWVTRLETSEVYSNCVLDSDMPIALSFFQPESSGLNQPLNTEINPISDPYQQMENNSSITLMEQNWIRADETRIQQIEDFYVKFIDVFNGVVGGNGLVQDINAQLNSANTAYGVVDVLRKFTLCDYEVISFSNRMKCINLIQNSNPYSDLLSFFNPSGLINAWGEAWTADEYNEVLVVKLVNGTKYNGQSDAMSAKLFENNSALFWKFFNYTDGAEYHGFMNTLLELTMVYNQTNPTVTIDFSQFENNKVLHSSYSEMNNRFMYKLMQSNTQGLTYDLISSVSPETLITVDLTSDLKLSNLSYFYEDFVGDQITIPAFYLHYMEEQRLNQNLTKAVMVLLDLAVIVGSAGVATPYAIVSIALAGSNIVVTMNTDAISQMSGGQDFLDVWSVVYLVDGLNGLAQIGAGIGKKVMGGSLKLFFSLDNMSAGLAQVKTSSAYIEAAESLAKVRRMWYFMQFSGEEVIASMMKSKMMMKLEEKVLKKNFVKIDPAADIEVLNLYNVRVQNSTHNSNVLTMTPHSEGAFLSGNIVDDIPANSTVTAQFDNVRYNSGSPTVQEGNLTVYQKANGQFVIVRGSANAQLSLLGKLDDYPIVQNWVSELDGVVDANLISEIDQIGSQYWAHLNTDLASVSNGAGLKTLMKESPNDLVNNYKMLKDDPKYSFELAKTGGSRWEKWAKGNFFKTVTKAGKDFEDLVCKAAFSNRNSAKYLELKQKFQLDFGKNLDEYEMFSQVQLKYNSNGDYFIADQIFVKYDAFGDYEDVLVLENKLSASTSLSPNQTNAIQVNSYTVRSVSITSDTNPNLVLQAANNEILNFAGTIQWYKVTSDGFGTAITNIQKIQ